MNCYYNKDKNCNPFERRRRKEKCYALNHICMTFVSNDFIDEENTKILKFKFIDQKNFLQRNKFFSFNI